MSGVAREKINTSIGWEFVVGTYSPPFGFEKDAKECSHVVDILRASEANVVLIGLGNLKQTIFLKSQ